MTAAIGNTHWRDNLLETAPAKAAAAGDLFYATAANAIAALTKGTAGQVVTMNAGETAPEWAAGNFVPAGMIAIFDAACPTGWTRVSAFDGLFLRGAASYGGTGGADTHTHTGSSHQHKMGIGNMNAPIDCIGWDESGEYGTSGTFTPTRRIGTSTLDSTETADFLTSAAGTGDTGSASSLPSYIEVIFCKKT